MTRFRTLNSRTRWLGLSLLVLAVGCVATDQKVPRANASAAFPDLVRVGGCRIEQVGDILRLSGPTGGPTKMIQTLKEFTPPFRIAVRARTDSQNLRLYYGAGMLIFNWEMNPHELRLHDPETGKLMTFPERGFIEPERFHDIEWEVHRFGMKVSVDGEVVAQTHGNLVDLTEPVGIGPAFGSVLTVERFEVVTL